MTMVLNWISSITRKASGTWSSDKEDVMSVAAECFCGRESRGQRCWGGRGAWAHQGGDPAHPKGPESEDDDDEVDDVGQEHERVDVSGGPVLRVQDVLEEAPHGPVHALGPAGGRAQSRPCSSQSKPLPSSQSEYSSRLRYTETRITLRALSYNCQVSGAESRVKSVMF